MDYTNASHVLPEELIRAIQQYVDGGLVYIPRRADNRLRWGSNSGSREALSRRNQIMNQDYHKGQTITDLADKYHLSEDSVRRIIATGSRRSAQSIKPTEQTR